MVLSYYNFIFMLVFQYLITETISYRNIEITRYSLCSKEQGLIKYYGRFTKEKGHNYLSFNATLPFPLGNNIGLNCIIQVSLDGATFRTLQTIRDKNACRAARFYLGGYWRNITNAANMPSRCPIPSGFYKAERVLLNLATLPLNNFPTGKIKAIIKVVNNTEPTMSFLCMVQEMELLDV